METAKQLPSGTWRSLVFSYLEISEEMNEDGHRNIHFI